MARRRRLAVQLNAAPGLGQRGRSGAHLTGGNVAHTGAGAGANTNTNTNTKANGSADLRIGDGIAERACACRSRRAHIAGTRRSNGPKNAKAAARAGSAARHLCAAPTAPTTSNARRNR